MCPANASCSVSQSSCGSNSCSLACVDHNSCSGSCGQSCSANCAGFSTCSLTVGSSGSVSCTGGATCHIVCTGSCSVSCAASNTNCDLKCPNDTAPRTVTQTAQCPYLWLLNSQAPLYNLNTA